MFVMRMLLCSMVLRDLSIQVQPAYPTYPYKDDQPEVKALITYQIGYENALIWIKEGRVKEDWRVKYTVIP